jgi:hypothetical protein
MTFQSTTRDSDILELEIADGLKRLLIEYGFTQQRILECLLTVGQLQLERENYLPHLS